MRKRKPVHVIIVVLQAPRASGVISSLPVPLNLSLLSSGKAQQEYALAFYCIGHACREYLEVSSGSLQILQ